MNVLLVMEQTQKDIQILVKLNEQKLINKVVGLVSKEKRPEAFHMVLQKGEFRNYAPADTGCYLEHDLVLRGQVDAGYGSKRY
ncbi:MAG: hypothetical protein HQL26_08640 [Candidatus Omnitrophica bacterium]|nr:hypothetical protein [Candidatus Omnitrophota bacterium]